MDSSFLLPQQEIEFFCQQGYVVIPGFFDPDETEQIRGWVEQVTDWADQGDPRGDHYFEETDRGRVLARSENFLLEHDGLNALLNGPRLLGAVGSCLGESAVLFKEKINYKFPGGGGFAPHQDATAYRYGTRHLTCLIAIDDSTTENGCLWFSGGHHLQGKLPQDGSGCLAKDFAESLFWKPASVASGGIVLFDSLAPHRSDGNQSDVSRRALYVTYNLAREGNFRDQYYRDRQQKLDSNAANGLRRISTIGHFQGQIVD